MRCRSICRSIGNLDFSRKIKVFRLGAWAQGPGLPWGSFWAPRWPSGEPFGLPFGAPLGLGDPLGSPLKPLWSYVEAKFCRFHPAEFHLGFLLGPLRTRGTVWGHRLGVPNWPRSSVPWVQAPMGPGSLEWSLGLGPMGPAPWALGPWSLVTRSLGTWASLGPRGLGPRDLGPKSRQRSLGPRGLGPKRPRALPGPLAWAQAAWAQGA